MTIREAKIKARSLNSVFLTRRCSTTLLTALAVVVLLGGPGRVQAILVSIELTANALELGSENINYGKTVDPDMPGFITSPVLGKGSILNIQTDGRAGFGTATDPLLVAITAWTRLDVTTGLPSSHDYQAGVISISKESDKTPDGKDEGLGVRAFTVDGDLKREVDSGSGLAKIEGSKDVSGGTDSSDRYVLGKLNGAPHTDEAVNFDFGPSSFYAKALSVEVLLSDFDPTDVLDLHIELTSGFAIDLPFLSIDPFDTSIFERVEPAYDKLWTLKFSGISQLQWGDLIDNFTIRANDDDPGNPRGTAEHFLINGIAGEVVAPEPATICLLGLGALALLRKRRT